MYSLSLAHYSVETDKFLSIRAGTAFPLLNEKQYFINQGGFKNVICR